MIQAGGIKKYKTKYRTKPDPPKSAKVTNAALTYSVSQPKYSAIPAQIPATVLSSDFFKTL